MTEPQPRIKDRRTALQEITGVGAIAGLLPLLKGFGDGQSPMSLFPSAYAQGINTGARPGQGRAFFISGAETEAIAMAEWEATPPPGSEAGAFRIAHGEGPVSRAPADASRYTAKAYDYPSGTLRVLTWKQGVPVIHMITYETEIMVLEGSVTLTPPRGLPGPTATLGPGDALHLPSGVLRNLNPTGDTVILQAFVGSTTNEPKRSIVLGKDVTEGLTAQWIEDGKLMSISTPEDLAKAPADAPRRGLKRYAFDGNSMRVARYTKGYKTNSATPTRTDVIIYISKGRMMRTEGDETFEVVAGDTVREVINTPGSWEVLEDAEFIATDAPMLPAAFNPAMISTGGGVKLFSMLNDENGRSHLGFAEVSMKKLSETESISEKQEGLYWRIGFRTALNPHSRTSKSFTTATGPYELHTGGAPHFTGCMSGNIESTLQDGSVLRRSAGEFCFITPGALHNSNFRSDVNAVYFNLYIPGTEDDTGPLVFK